MASFKGGKNKNDFFRGTKRADQFLFDPADLNSGDVVDGYGGTDTLVFTAGGVVTADRLRNVEGIERIQLSDAGNTIMLTQLLVETAADSTLVVRGGSGADKIDASEIEYLVTPTGLVRLFGGAGDDVLTGGFADQVIYDGGVGRDTITLAAGLAIYDPNDKRIVATGVDAFLKIATGMTLDLNRTGDLTGSDDCLVQGFRNVDASASRGSVTLVGAALGTLVGGRDADFITGGTTISGGKGCDTLIGGSAEGIHQFLIAEGDFVAREAIVGNAKLDELIVSGSVDFRAGTVTGMDFISVRAGEGTDIRVAFYTAQVASVQSISGYTSAPGQTVTVELYFEGPSYTNLTDTFSDTVLYGNDDGNLIEVDTIGVLAGAGADFVIGQGDMAGGAGDDTLFTDLRYDAVRLVDGGEGTDSLVLIAAIVDVSFDLSAADQSLGDDMDMRGFEELDLSRLAPPVVLTVRGSAADNDITGGGNVSDLSGEAGNDILEAGAGSAHLNGGDGDDLLVTGKGLGYDILIGGAGQDTFRWLARPDAIDLESADRVLDFGAGADRLSFDAAAFGFAGDAFDTRVVASGPRSDITGADLVIYRAGSLDTTGDVADYLAKARGGSDAGLFVAGLNADGHLLLFHALSGVSGAAEAVSLVADLGDIGRATDLTLADFAFI